MERVFVQSAVMSAAFAQFHPNLVVGGTYSGQIVLWDNRSNKRTPVQRTPLSASAHTVHTHTHRLILLVCIHTVLSLLCVYLQHPVYCVNVLGTQNAHNLISISTDGKMCSWSLDMLSTPQVHHSHDTCASLDIIAQLNAYRPFKLCVYMFPSLSPASLNQEVHVFPVRKIQKLDCCYSLLSG